MSESGDEDFVEFCRQCTDKQLENVLRDEYARYQHGDYISAKLAAAERGWRVFSGQRLQ